METILKEKDLDELHEKIMKSDFKLKVGERIIADGRDMTIVDREYRIGGQRQRYKYYKYHCNKCGYENWKIETGMINRKYDKKNNNQIIVGCGGGCACCSNQVVVSGINDMATTAPWMIEYLANKEDAYKYTKSSQQLIEVKCPDCGRVKPRKIKINTLYNTHSIGCSCKDGMSFIEKYILNILIQLKVNYKQEHRFDYWDKYYNKYKNKYSFALYDFVIEDKKLIIEADGGFHRADNTKTGQTKEESQWIDLQKDNLAKENGYKVIRISDEGNIKENVLNSELQKYYNLKDIDWIKCGQFALSNFDKIICERWNNRNKDETPKDLALEFGRCKMGIVKILKKGAKYNWCNYNPKEEHEKNSIRLRKRVSVYNKYGEYIDTFNSYKELEKVSEDRLGVKITVQNISNFITKRRETPYKGYIFKLAK